MASVAEERLIGIDASGAVFVQEEAGERYENIETHQQVLSDEVLTLDQAFARYRVGGTTVPDLLSPGRRVAVHPQVSGGLPVLKGRRIPAIAIGSIARKSGTEVARSAYPELSAAEVSDAIRVAKEVEAVRAR